MSRETKSWIKITVLHFYTAYDQSNPQAKLIVDCKGLSEEETLRVGTARVPAGVGPPLPCMTKFGKSPIWAHKCHRAEPERTGKVCGARKRRWRNGGA